MKLVALVFAAMVAVALTASVEQAPAQIIRSDFEQRPEGGYNYAYETEDGIQKNENGEIKEVNDEDNKPQQVVVVRGSYSWTDEQGQKHNVNYVADEKGFQPESADIPRNA